jgi:phosphoribosylanthranilate isomerase
MKVKVCCIASIAEARLAVAAGADVLGLVSHMPSGPGVIADALSAEIVASVPAYIESFLLTSRTRAQAIAAQHALVRSSALQLVDHVPVAELRELRQCCPGVKLVQVIHVMGEASIDEAYAAAPWVDALLLDSGNPQLAVKELGGTGRTHDWACSRRIRDAVWPLPLFLAGGLHAGNAAAAVAAVQPYGLDVCSGLRSAGALDAHKLRDFMAALREPPP